MKHVCVVGFRAGLLAAFFTIAYVVVQLLQVQGLLSFPTDEYLIYGSSLCIVIPFVVEILALHYATPVEKRFWTHAAILFTVIYAMFVTANYVVQLATVIPMKLKGEGNEVKILEQTPHSLFWNFDAIGYISMGVAMLFAVPALDRSRQQRYARAALLANGLVTPLIMFVYFYPHYSESLLIIGSPWGVTAPLAMVMLAVMLKSKIGKGGKTSNTIA